MKTSAISLPTLVFIAASTLSIIGAASLNTVKKPSQFMFGAVPLLFGLQQFWKTWIPLSFRLIETNRLRRFMMTVICVFGIIASLLLGFRLSFTLSLWKFLRTIFFMGSILPNG